MAERPAKKGAAHAEGLARTSPGDSRLKETVHHPSGGSSPFYELDRIAHIVDDGICALAGGQPAFDRSPITREATFGAPW